MLKWLLRLYYSDYIEAAVNGKLSKIFLFDGFVLYHYILLWYANIFLNGFYFCWIRLFFADEFNVQRTLGKLESRTFNSLRY